MLAYYVHDLDPVIVRLGPITPRWYGFAYLCGFVAAYLLLKKLAKWGMLRMPGERVQDLVLNCCIFGVLVGGRLGHCFLYEPSLLGLARDASGHVVFPYWGVLAVWHGGMSAHGGIVMTILTLIIFSWKNKFSIANVGDAACLVVAVGLGFGRIANFVNGELYGRPTTVSWAVKFPTELVNPTDNKYDAEEVGNYLLAHQQAAVVEFARSRFLEENLNGIEDVKKAMAQEKMDAGALARGMQFADEQLLVEKAKEKFPAVKITGIGDVVTLLHEGTAAEREPIRSWFEGMASLPPRHPSQIYQCLLEGAALFSMVWWIGMKWRWDGMASGAFLTLYPVMRILGEQFRVGDSPWMGVSLGVWYSLAMIVPGAVYWIYWIKRRRVAVWAEVKGTVVLPKKEAAKEDGGNGQ